MTRLGVIALQKKVFDLKELRHIGLLFIFALIAFAIAFYKENIVATIRTVASLFWLFVIPGYFVMFYWHEKINFVERIVIGTLFCAGIAGFLSYYFGLVGLNIMYHAILLPFVLILLGVLLSISRKKQ